MNTASKPMYGWQDIPWKRVERDVFKLQKRIYRASSRGDARMVHKLQKLLMKSWHARLLAVRRVTQDNQGKRTAGVDGVKTLTPPQRLKLAKTLRPTEKAKPVRRVWIPKPGKNELRPLGIPTMENRAQQALVKLALEPEWEAQFEPNSYGFRPGRSCHDAIGAIYVSINHKPKYVLDADIAKCFDRICHSALLDKLNTFPAMRRIVKAWLKSGVMDGKELYPTTEGSPQGGPASPLIANIALHGLETAVQDAFTTTEGKPAVIKYADDFVVLHPDLATIERCQQVVSEWLTDLGLELKPSKTRITHTLHQHEGNLGFDFLGFNIRQYLIGKNHSGKTGGRGNKPLGFKTIIKPSKEAIGRHTEAISEVVTTHKTAPQAALINHINPLIKGWTSYYSTVSSKQTFSMLTHVTYLKLRRWAKRRHPKKSGHWVAGKYWRLETGRWDFATRDDVKLFEHHKMPIQRHVKVRGTKSPYDGDWSYWASRLGKHPQLPKRVAILLKWQKGKCALCGLYFRDGDLPEIDHFIPLSQGGKDAYINWQLIHRHCHDQKTARDGSLAVRSAPDRSQIIEEPDEGKPSRPVL